MGADLFRVDIYCSGKAFSSGQNSEKSLIPLAGEERARCPLPRIPSPPRPFASIFGPAPTITTLPWE